MLSKVESPSRKAVYGLASRFQLIAANGELHSLADADSEKAESG